MTLNGLDKVSGTFNLGPVSRQSPKRAQKPDEETVGNVPSDRVTISKEAQILSSISNKMSENNIKGAISDFKKVIDYYDPSFAEKVLESAPIFAAFVLAAMSIDEIMAEFKIEKGRAKTLKDFAEECSKKTKMVQPVSETTSAKPLKRPLRGPKELS